MINQENLYSFLKLGYFLDYNPVYSFDYSDVNKDIYKNLSENELIEMGSSLLIRAVGDDFKESKDHVVPISGGLDSRAILATLLEFTEATNIYTYTFGTPGTLDYDIGNSVANEIGSKHINFPLTEYNYNMDELLDISKRVDHQTVLFHHPPVWELDEKFGDCIIWSGFFGDPLVGSHYNNKIPNEINSSIGCFLNKNTYQKEIELISNKDHNFHNLIDTNLNESHEISVPELLNFNNRQLKFIAPHVLMKGFNYNTPFLYKDLFDFFLSINNKYRENQYLYQSILLKTFPKLFSYPVKSKFGLPLKTSSQRVFIKRAINKCKRKLKITTVNKHINYLDFDTAIRERTDLNKIVRLNINDLYNRKLIDWLDVRTIYEDHVKRNINYGKALLLLTSLEIHFKAKEMDK